MAVSNQGRKPNGRKVVQIKFYIPEELRVEFVNIVKSKYRSLHGGLSFEGEAALRSWVNTHKEHTQLVPIVMNPSYPHVHVIMDQIVLVLKETYGYQCSVPDLKKVIGKIRGNDERTIKRWTKQLFDEKKIKWLNAMILEVV